MATSALANWRDCLLGLEHAFSAVSDSSIRDISHARSAACSALKGAIRKQSSLPKSTWHKLVAELQVPLRLSSTCKDAILLQLDAASTTSALSVLVAFLTSASQSQTLLGQTKTSKLLLAIQQQVKQSGLLECLPQLYLSTAEARRSAAVLKEAAAGDTFDSSLEATFAARWATSCDPVSDDGNDVTDRASIADSLPESGSSSSCRDKAFGNSNSGSSSSNHKGRPDGSDSATMGHNSISQLEAYSDMLLPLYVQLSTLLPSEATGTAPGSRRSRQLGRVGAGSLAACSIAASQLIFAVLLHTSVQCKSEQPVVSHIRVLNSLSDKAALALGALSGQLAASLTTMHPDGGTAVAALDSAATQLLLSPNFMLSLSYLTVLTALTGMYLEQAALQRMPFSQGSKTKATTCPESSSSSSSSTSSHSSSAAPGRGSHWSGQDVHGDTSLHEPRHSSGPESYSWLGLFPGMGPYHVDMLQPFGIHVTSLLGPASLDPGKPVPINYADAAQQLLLADISMLTRWMYCSEIQQYQRQAVQPHLQLMVQCMMLPCVLAQWAPGSSCHGFVTTMLSRLVHCTPAATPPQPAADTVMSVGPSCSNANPQHNQVAPGPGTSSSSPAAAAGAAADNNDDDDSDSVGCQEQQPLMVVDAQQITTQVLSDHESFVRCFTQLDPLARKSHWIDAALRNIATLYEMLQWMNPFVSRTMVSGHNSPEQQQLHSLCCSMLKLSASRMSWRDDTANQLRWAAASCSACVATGSIPGVAVVLIANMHRLRTTGRLAAAEGAASDLSSSPCIGGTNDQASSSASSDCPYHDAASNSAAASGASAAARLSTVSSMPAIAIFGRCCLQVSQQLKEQIPVILQQRLSLLLGQPMLRGQPGCPFPPENGRALTDAAGACLEPLGEPVEEAMGSVPLLLNIMMLLGKALSPKGVRFEGSELWKGELLELAGAAACAFKNPLSNAEPLVALVKQLHAAGLACCSHPVAPMCNNPSCSTTRGDTELELVTGKSCMCGGCRVAHYCCRACQQEHWELHKPACKALVAAAAAAANSK